MEIIGSLGEKIYFWHHDGTPIKDLIKIISTQPGSGWASRHSPVLDDIDNDGDIELILGRENYIFVWDLDGEYRPNNIEWGSFQNDMRNTGLYHSNHNDENNPPYAPNNPTPVNGDIDVNIDALLSWSGGDPDASDNVVYDVYFGSNSNPGSNELVSVGQSSLSYDLPGDLEYLTTYYWQIVARDSYADETSGVVWEFTTIEDSGTNNPPYKPGDPTPGDSTIDVSVNVDFVWSGGDPDDGDTVTYDIYFGTNSNPPRVKQNHPTTTYNPGTLNPNTQYYWKLIPEDNHGETNPGELWSFITGEESPRITISYKQLNMREISINIKNLESNEISNVEWKIEMTGGIINLVDLTSNGSINKIEAGSTITIISDEYSFGLGHVDIKTEVKVNGEIYRVEKDGIIIGPFLIIL